MKVLISSWALLFSFWAFSAPSGKRAQTIVNEETKTLKDAQESQRKINSISDKTQDLLRKYRQTLQQIENAKIYNEQLQKIIATQEEEKISIAAQIKEITETSKRIVPMMVEKVKNFEKIVELDTPFLPEERAKRVNKLKATLNRADVSESEKFRHVLEAYQVENDYGRTIESYRGIKKTENGEKTVDYLRVGRVAFVYQTLDAKETGVFNPTTRKWEELGSSYKKSVRQAIKMAKKQVAPQLVKLPIFAPMPSEKGDAQ